MGFAIVLKVSVPVERPLYFKTTDATWVVTSPGDGVASVSALPALVAPPPAPSPAMVRLTLPVSFDELPPHAATVSATTARPSRPKMSPTALGRAAPAPAARRSSSAAGTPARTP
jgi:hypothetical protein